MISLFGADAIAGANGLLAICLGVFALLALAAGALAILRSNYLRSSVELLRANNEDLTARVAVLEGDVSRANSTVARLEAENALLHRMATGRDLIEALATDVARVHQETLSRLQGVEDAVVERLDDLKGLAGARRERERAEGSTHDASPAAR